jgi:hypothetical protein
MQYFISDIHFVDKYIFRYHIQDYYKWTALAWFKRTGLSAGHVELSGPNTKG